MPEGRSSLTNRIYRLIRRFRKGSESSRPRLPRKPPMFAYSVVNRLMRQFMAEDASLRAEYTWGVLHAAHLARSLGIEAMSAVELGVAGGNGLCALEGAAIRAGDALGVRIDVWGFDMGRGLPAPEDYRDMPNLYTEGDYAMNADRLRGRLRRAQLILGNVSETVPQWLGTAPAPIGFISCDLDYYTSTRDSLVMFDADPGLLLPRVHCYFDDVLGFTCSEFTGERLAIDEFNRTHFMRKIAPMYGIRYYVPEEYRDESFADKYWMAHFFDHPLHNARDGLVHPRAASDLTMLHAVGV